MKRFFVSMGMGGVTALASIPSIAFGAPQTFSELVALIVLIINVATPTLIGLALVFFLYRMISTSFGGDKGVGGFAASKVRTVAFYGIGILFVMVSIWGILGLLEQTFLTSGGGELSGTEQGPSPCDSLDDC